jgi:hypothetical protein
VSEYRIEKVRRRVTVTLVGGATLEGDVFLQPMARYRAGPQEPVELFDEPEPFVPLGTDDDELVLIAKEQVSRVQFADEHADTPGNGVTGVEVEVVFDDGSSCRGQLQMETRASRSRVLDFLNEDHQRFLVLWSADGVCLANRRHVAQVRHRR